MKKNNNLTLPTSLLLVATILGGFYCAGEVGKQKSIERQKKLEVEEEVRIRNLCDEEAEERAKSSLESKAELSAGTSMGATYKKAVENNMYLKDDFETAYKQCLSRYGIK